MAEKRVMDRNDKGRPLGILSPCEREIAAIRFKVPDSGNSRMAHIHETLVHEFREPESRLGGGEWFAKNELKV
jgi:hypothetical protein